MTKLIYAVEDPGNPKAEETQAKKIASPEYLACTTFEPEKNQHCRGY
jgi:hypothetical protein